MTTNITYSTLKHNAETGDLLFLSSNSPFIKITQYFKTSKYNHVAMIIKYPTFMGYTLFKPIYVLETTFNLYSTDNPVIFKPSLLSIDDFIAHYKDIAHIHFRKVYFNRHSTKLRSSLNEAWENCVADYYDSNVIKWVRNHILGDAYKMITHNDMNSCFPCFGDNSRYSNDILRFWSASFITYFLIKMGVIQDTSWYYISPDDLATAKCPQRSPIHFSCYIDNEVDIDFDFE